MTEQTDFERGFIAGWEAAHRLQPPISVPTPFFPSQTPAYAGCPTCGMGKDDLMSNFVCTRWDCPSRVVAWAQQTSFTSAKVN